MKKKYLGGNLFGISTLIFSCNDIPNTIDLIKDIDPVSNEIVVIDSSDKNEKKLLHSEKKRLKLDKVKIFDGIAIGAAPLRMYGLKNCNYEWVLNIDTDERICDVLKKDVKRIIKDPKVNAYAIKRYENVKDNNNKSAFTWQLRLLRKEKVAYKGYIHELADVKGVTQKLPEEYHINHETSKRISESKLDRYFLIESMQSRLSYERLLKLCKDRNLPPHLLNVYIALLHRSKSEELTKNEYKFFLINYSFIVLFANTFPFMFPKRYLGWDGSLPYNYNMKKINYFFSIPAEERRKRFEISQEIFNSDGVINYLHLSNPDVIKRLKLASEKLRLRGVDIFVYALKARHSLGPRYYTEIPK